MYICVHGIWRFSMMNKKGAGEATVVKKKKMAAFLKYNKKSYWPNISDAYNIKLLLSNLLPGGPVHHTTTMMPNDRQFMIG